MIGVLVSGTGTNLQALIDDGLPIAAVASNKPRAAALERARLKARQERLRREHERRMRELLRKLRVQPGRECEVEAVRREIDCVSGRLPIGKPKR